MYIYPNEHFPEWTLARMDICPNGHLSEFTLARMNIYSNGNLPDGYFPEWTVDTGQDGDFPEWTYGRITQNVATLTCLILLLKICGSFFFSFFLSKE